MDPHVIRLHSAWEEPSDSAPATEGVRGYKRSFHQPTGLLATDRVWLLLGPVLQAAGLTLNGQSLRERNALDEPLAFDITELVRGRNELRLQDEHWTRAALDGRRHALPEGMIWLEIRGAVDA